MQAYDPLEDLENDHDYDHNYLINHSTPISYLYNTAIGDDFNEFIDNLPIQESSHGSFKIPVKTPIEHKFLSYLSVEECVHHRSKFVGNVHCNYRTIEKQTLKEFLEWLYLYERRSVIKASEKREFNDQMRAKGYNILLNV